MSVDAVIFDLWKTLVPLTDETKRCAFESTAEALGEDTSFLLPHWNRTRVQRETMDLRRYIHELGAALGRSWTAAQVDDAIAARRSHHMVGFRHPFPDASVCLRTLRESKIPVGVISNGTTDIPDMITISPLSGFIDHVEVSGVFGAMKPDPSIYLAVVNALGASPDRTVYVGDGHDSELEGARNAGCRALLVDRGTPNFWDGDFVETLEAIPALIDSAKTERNAS